MVGPRFSVNALAETKFISLVTIAYWQTLKKYPTRSERARFYHGRRSGLGQKIV